jgi:hypothetical protein
LDKNPVSQTRFAVISSASQVSAIVAPVIAGAVTEDFGVARFASDWRIFWGSQGVPKSQAELNDDHLKAQ